MMKSDSDNPKPNFIGIGAQKCATTWLSECLRHHPEVFMSQPKEIHFFETEANWNNGVDWYLEHFRSSGGFKARGEYSPSYLSHPVSAQRIKDVLGPVKILVSLRNPVSRFISHYKHLIRQGKLLKEEYSVLNAANFERATKLYPQLINNGSYYSDLNVFIDIFGRENLWIMIKEDIDANPQAELRKTYEFLEVDADFVPSILTKKVSPGIVPKFSALEDMRLRLFRTFNRRAPWVIGHVRKLRLAELYRKLNTAKQQDSLKTEDAAMAAIRSTYQEEIQNTERLLNRQLTAWKPK